MAVTAQPPKAEGADGDEKHKDSAQTGPSWLGSTLPEWDEHERGSSRPSANSGAYWSRADGSAFQVRTGPSYPSKGKKAPSAKALYECVAVDIVRAPVVVSEVLGRLCPVPPAEADSKDGGLAWQPGCALPRVLCMVTMLPYTCDWTCRTPSRDVHLQDPGCSIVAVFTLRRETLEMLRRPEKELPASIRLLRDFVARATSGEQCAVGDHRTTGVLKLIALAQNPDDIKMSSVLKSLVGRWNGTPALVTKSGYVHKGPQGEWLEIDVDVRCWSLAARNALYKLRDVLESASLQVGVVVQGVEDTDLPEGIVGACQIHGLNLDKSPVTIDDPRAKAKATAAAKSDVKAKATATAAPKAEVKPAAKAKTTEPKANGKADG
eukprot:TRINITY_DN62848_c0_g1_i1.p1 TRINITY_DN62848_c0_g1~~TRINITY_DN62848_c0_g1_i1.p1  ORF type:complete len:378 (-),score=81.10 TRINITY_DN62848_c0_g1_i1:312-1445(-)